MPKRLRNMVRRKNRPGWYFRRKRDGKTVWIALGADYEEACRKLRELKGTEDIRIVHLTVREAARKWVSLYIETARNPKGRELARRRVDLYLEPVLGHLLLRKVRPDDLRRYRIHLESLGNLQVQTVRHLLADARCFFNWCEGAGFIDRSPFPKRLLPRIQERPPDRLTDEEVMQLSALPDPYGFVIRLALATGLRWGELVRASSTDLNGGSLVVSHTKSGKVRRIPLEHEPSVLAELRNRVGRLLPFKDSWGFTQIVRREAGVVRFHPHQLRHTFACRWLERGGSLPALQQILGHSSIVTTQRYGRLSDEHVAAESRRLAGGRGSLGGCHQRNEGFTKAR